jgi:hypothetical protein
MKYWNENFPTFLYQVSVSPDTVAIRDQNDERVVHLFDITNGKPLNDGNPFAHRLDVTEVALDQTGSVFGVSASVGNFSNLLIEI